MFFILLFDYILIVFVWIKIDLIGIIILDFDIGRFFIKIISGINYYLDKELKGLFFQVQGLMLMQKILLLAFSFIIVLVLFSSL